MIKCTLFTTNLWPVDSAFVEGDEIAIVIADTGKVDTAMKQTVRHYVNDAKIQTHSAYLKKNLFEIPLVYVHDGAVEWVEGFHQVTAAKEAGLKVIPLTTAARMAPELIALVGADDEKRATMTYSFAECADARRFN